jgi:hypothetical protein
LEDELAPPQAARNNRPEIVDMSSKPSNFFRREEKPTASRGIPLIGSSNAA